MRHRSAPAVSRARRLAALSSSTMRSAYADRRANFLLLEARIPVDVNRLMMTDVWYLRRRAQLCRHPTLDRGVAVPHVT